MPVDWSKYGGDSTNTERRSASRVNWDDYDPEIQTAKKRREGVAIRASQPDLFNPAKQVEATKKAIRPIQGPPAPSDLGAKRRQQAAQSSPLTRLGEFAANLATDVIPGNFGNEQVRRPIEQASRIPDIPGITTANPATNFIRGAGDMATLGVSSYLDRMSGNVDAAEGATQTTAGKIGQYAGAFALPAGRLKAGASLISNVGRGAGAGAVLGFGMEGGELATGRNDQTLGQRAIDVGINTALGGAGVAAIAGLGKAAQAVINKYRKPASTPVPTLGLPAPRSRGNVNTAEPTQPITPDYTFGLPEASPTSLNRQVNARQARGELRVIDDEIRQLNANYERAIVDEYNYLKGSMGQKSQKGTIIKDQVTGDVTGRVGTISGNPKWYQEISNKANGYKRPSNKELYDLARKRVDEGFQDEQGAVPSWKVQNGFDENLASLQEVRDTINQSLREIDPAINITDTPIKGQELTFNPQPKRQAEVLPAQPIRNVSEPVNVRRSDPVQEADEIVQTVQQPRVRDRVYNYLDEAEKAARERISKRRNRLSANPLDEWGDHAIIMAAKLGKGTIKTTDFTEALVREFGEQVRPHADRIFRQTKEVLRRQERRASKEGRDAEQFNNSGQGDAATFDRKISRDVKKKKTLFSQRWENIRTQFIDDLAPLEGLEKRVKGSLASAEDSLYKAARLFKGTPEKAAQVVRTRLAPVVESIEKAGYTADDLGRYALARHAKDVNAAGYKSGFTNAEIDDVIAKYGNEQMEQARQSLVQINKDMLQELVSSGVVSRELADTLNERWKNYIPLFRAFDDDKVEFSGALTQALANVTSPIKTLKGSERAVVDPLENMVKNIFQSTNAAERNKVATQLAKLAKSDNEEMFIRKLGEDEQVGRKNIVTVKEAGQSVRYEVEPEVYKAMLNLDTESGNLLVNILSKPANLLRGGATLTPEFSLRNPMRDVLQAFITSESGFTPFDFVAGLAQTIKKGDVYEDWIKNLGAYGNVLSMDRNVHRQALEEVLKQPASKKFVNVVTGKSLLRVLRAISDTTESATKVGEYRAALRKGASKQEAAFRSRDIMDFARAGTSVRQVNKVVAFLNANVQGKSKLIRSIKERPSGTIARAVASVTAPTIAIYALNETLANEEQRKTIEEAPDWMKDTFWLIAIPGTDTVARIPKPFDIAPIFANLPERALKYYRDNDKQAFDGFVRRTLGDSALPVQITGLWPFIEGMANYSFFREGPIIPQREANLKPGDQYDPVRTTETAKLLASLVEGATGGKGMFGNFSSPRIADNTIKGLTAGLGTYATSAIDTILSGKYFGKQAYPSIVDRPTAPQKRIEQQPFVKAFTVDPLQNTKSMDRLYTRREELTKEKGSAKLNDKKFQNAPELKRLDSAAGRLSDINKEIRSIEADLKMNAAEKRRRIEPLLAARNRISKETMQAVRK